MNEYSIPSRTPLPTASRWIIKFSGPAFAAVDSRLMTLQLVEQGLTDAAMAGGEVGQPAEVLCNQPVLIERGSFRPVTNVTLEMLDSANRQCPRAPARAREPVVDHGDDSE